MTIKLVAFDMDGTFLNDQNTYNHARFAELLTKLRAKGIHVVAASGSQYQRLQTQFEQFQDQMDFVSQNGAVVHSNGDLLSVTAMPAEAVAATLDVIHQQFAPSDIAEHLVAGLKSAYVDDQITPAAYELTHRYYDHLLKVPSLATITPERLQDQVTSIGVTFQPGVDFGAALQTLRQALPAGLGSQTSGYNTELISEGSVNKAAGLRHLQARYNVANDELMTFGDNENDLSMLTLTPHGYAMANATDHVKAQVTHHAGTNNAEGVLDVLATLVA